MIDIFALSVSHAVLLFALWRLVQDGTLDREGPEEAPRAARKPEPPRA
ncbi:hypothetical protein ACFFF7_11450 [Novosphingobium aquiterrae]|uniref:Uncharacterized protein n=1 Tax=Novosphingobium aquiterrae TaxID=624388 RepID=A0ABV6PJL9_9SPHN